MTRGGLVGGLIAVVLFVLHERSAGHLEMSLALEHFMRITWPSADWLMATEGIESTVKGWLMVGFSIGTNALLYAAVAGLISVFRTGSSRREE
jgi:hypothetical protein